MSYHIDETEEMYRKYFESKGIRIGILNGKMSAGEIADTVDSFAGNEIQILISTIIIEVGVNVPNAMAIVIEQAERFGLASLHQLRGRVGRSSMQSYCILISQDKENERQRGSGNLMAGGKQSGFDKFVDLMLQNRVLYDLEVRTVTEFGQTGYLNRLAMVYNEHQKAVDEKAR